MTDQLNKDTSLTEIILLSFQKNLAEVQVEIEGVIENQDIEYVHRMRIALRRLRNNLKIFQYYGNPTFRTRFMDFYNQTMPLACLLAGARDLDIQLKIIPQLIPASNPIQFAKFIDLLLTNRLIQQQGLVDYFKQANYSETFSAFLRDLPVYLSNESLPDPQYLKTLPNRTICSLIFLNQAQLYLINSLSSYTEIHQFRKVLRRLRYTLESFANCVQIDQQLILSHLHLIQDQLGALHDLDMLQLSLSQVQNQFKINTKRVDLFFQTARQPHHAAFMGACQSGEVMASLVELQKPFEMELHDSIGNNKI